MAIADVRRGNGNHNHHRRSNHSHHQGHRRSNGRFFYGHPNQWSLLQIAVLIVVVAFVIIGTSWFTLQNVQPTQQGVNFTVASEKSTEGYLLVLCFPFLTSAFLFANPSAFSGWRRSSVESILIYIVLCSVLLFLFCLGFQILNMKISTLLVIIPLIISGLAANFWACKDLVGVH
jgi:hypothetical protein